MRCVSVTVILLGWIESRSAALWNSLWLTGLNWAHWAALQNRQLYRGERVLCGFWSLGISWQRDIKAASRLLLAANYIKRPCSSAPGSGSDPAGSIFRDFSLRRVCEFRMRRSTRCRRSSQPHKHQGHVWQQHGRLKDTDWQTVGRWS